MWTGPAGFGTKLGHLELLLPTTRCQHGSGQKRPKASPGGYQNRTSPLNSVPLKRTVSHPYFFVSGMPLSHSTDGTHHLLLQEANDNQNRTLKPRKLVLSFSTLCQKLLPKGHRKAPGPTWLASVLTASGVNVSECQRRFQVHAHSFI